MKKLLILLLVFGFVGAHPQEIKKVKSETHWQIVDYVTERIVERINTICMNKNFDPSLTLKCATQIEAYSDILHLIKQLEKSDDDW